MDNLKAQKKRRKKNILDKLLEAGSEKISDDEYRRRNIEKLQNDLLIVKSSKLEKI